MTNGLTLTSYLRRVGIALSVLLNVLLLGPSNQTFSARNYAWKRAGKYNIAFVIDFLSWHLFRDQHHCLTSWIYWRVRKDVMHEHEIAKANKQSNVGPFGDNANEPIYY